MQVMAAADTADTSDTAAGFASMSPFWIILRLFSPRHILLPLVFATIKVHYINFNASVP